MGLKHGFGREWNPDGSRYEGNYQDGLHHGKGIFFTPSDRIVKFTGEFVRGLPVEGQIQYRDGSYYSGKLRSKM